MFSTVLVANRGEIALRVMRACRELNLRVIAIYSEADRDAMHVKYADEAFLVGPAPAAQSYLDIDAILHIAQQSNAGAIHPGYGFLAENPVFARKCRNAGLVFIGPSPEAMERLGGKVAARREATLAGVPIVPGTEEVVTSPDEIRQIAAQFGYPIAIKASAGGGGRGLRVVAGADDIETALDSARREAAAYFKNDEVYVEKYLTNPRHIELQVLADTYGRVLHLGERDCSVQRRHQKLIEEAPSTVLTSQQRAEMGAAAVRLVEQVGYTSAGTLEFMWEEGNFYFLEMNTRIQVEHTVTEEITGIDLVKWQIRIAQGASLPWRQDQIEIRGHAIECRINAEDPASNFSPSLGTLTTYVEPHGFGIRVDSGYDQGMTIPPHYDSLIAKLIAWGQDRDEAVARMRRALRDFEIGGIRSTLPFHRWALAHPVFRDGQATVRFIEDHLDPALLDKQDEPMPAVSDDPDALASMRAFAVEVNGRRFQVRVAEQGAAPRPRNTPSQRPSRQREEQGSSTDTVRSPMGGTIATIRVELGSTIKLGQVLFVIEAMKMENEIVAPRAGTIDKIHVEVGSAVQAGETLLTFA